MAQIAMRYGMAGERAEQTQGETVTPLWTNSNPSSSFASQTITLSQSADNFQKLRIEAYRTGGDSYTIDFDISDPSIFLNGDLSRFSISAISSGTSYTYVRYAYFNGAYNKIYWSTGYRTASTSTSANICKPSAIYGVN